MASKVSLVLVLAAAALASARLTVTISPQRQALIPFTSTDRSPFAVTFTLNTKDEHVIPQDVTCHVIFAYLDFFGQPWAHPHDAASTGFVTLWSGNDMWTAYIPYPADDNQVVEASGYCTYHGQKIWAEGTGNILFQKSY
eukprot:m51a1_g484 hypothetical protein (140) ;mRNA; f:220351-220850